MAGTPYVHPLAAAPGWMLNRPARRLWVALHECADATLPGKPASHLAWPKSHERWKRTALDTLADLRLVVRYGAGWRVTDAGRAALAASS